MDFLSENENEVIRNIHSPDLFIPDSFEVVHMGVGITFIVGVPRDKTLIQQLLNPEKVLVQAVKFIKPDWDLANALEWLKLNQKDFKEYKTTTKEFAADLKEIKGVEIFSAGIWNGDEYTTDHIDEMVRAFDATSETARPYLKLGHNDDQELTKADGMPAAGWIGRIYREGEKLVADFIDIPNKIYELIENKSYRNVSSEIFFDVKTKGGSFDLMLKAVSLLGADTPAVSNLADILARFGLKDYAALKTFAENEKDVTIKTYSIENEINFKQGETIMSKTEKEIALELKLEAMTKANKELETSNKQFETDLESRTTELETSNKAKTDAEAKVFATEKEKEAIALEAQVDTLINEKLISKAMKPFAIAILENKMDEKTKKFSIKSGDDSKELDRYELLKEFATLGKTVADVNFEENSTVEDDKKTNEVDEIAKYAIDNKVDYATAYRQFNAGKLAVDKPNVKEE